MLAGYAAARAKHLLLTELKLNSKREFYDLAAEKFETKSSTIKNYADEFDALLPNDRKGWHQRSPRPLILEVHSFGIGLDDGALVKLVSRALKEGVRMQLPATRRVASQTSRQETGIRAEEIFWANSLPIVGLPQSEIRDYRYRGTGYDFRSASADRFFEVKGFTKDNRHFQMTQKEFEVASLLREQYLLVAINVDDHRTAVFPDPTSVLEFLNQEVTVTQRVYSSRIRFDSS